MLLNETIERINCNLTDELKPVHVYRPMGDDRYSLLESIDWESAHQLIDYGYLNDFVIVDSINGRVFTIVESTMVEEE